MEDKDEENIPPCVILIGFARSGKDTAADYLSEKYGYKKRSSGTKMKDLMSYMPVYIENIEKDGTKVYKTYKEWIDLYGYEECKDKVTGFRKALVGLGHGARIILYEDIWIDRSLEDVKKGYRVVVADGRYQSEINKTRELGGIAIEVQRTEPANETERNSLKDIRPNYRIINKDITLEEFKQKLDTIMKIERTREGKELDMVIL